jgi:hypothetical protein
MNKTKVLLAFGAHKRNGMTTNADFFKTTVGPFIDENVARGGKRAVIIYDFPKYEPFGRRLGADEMREYLGQTGKRRVKDEEMLGMLLDQREKTLNMLLTLSINRGIKTNLDPDWGFEETVLRINKRRQDEVRCVAEPKSIEVTHAKWMMELLGDGMPNLADISGPKALDAMIEFMKAHAEWMILRDRLVIRTVDRLRERVENAVIVIPRSPYHKKMGMLFDDSRYDVSVREDGTALDFLFEVTAARYNGGMKDGELEGYAKLQLKALEFFEQGARRAGHRFFSMVMGEDYASGKLVKAARDYALGHNQKP